MSRTPEPRRAMPYAPHWLMPTPCPQPRPLIVKTGSPAADCAGAGTAAPAQTVAARKATMGVRCLTASAVEAPTVAHRRRGVPNVLQGNPHDRAAEAAFPVAHGGRNAMRGRRAMAPVNDILPPRYRNASLVGRGGMGEIYRATDDALGREVAVKVLSDAYAWDDDVRERFKREARAAARVSADRNVVDIYDVGEWNGRPYIVMEYVDGGSVADRLRDGAPPLADSMRWLE